ncbi:MAG TPA: hypothetical protein VF771_00860 [Longimicrobiaceae bacterium]
MRVEADLFSGRPNPTFTLDAEQAATLATLLRGLPAGGQRREPPGLGYRGFVIRDAGDALPGCTTLRAFHGIVTAECGAESRDLADPAQTVERWLLDVARPKLSAEVVDVIRGELAQP